MNERDMHEVTYLADVALFHGLTADQLLAIAAIAEPRYFKPGDILIHEGDSGDAMYVLVKGRVRVSRTLTLSLSRTTVGEAEKSFAEFDDSEHPSFGEMALLENTHRGATVTLLTTGEVLEIRHDDFVQLCEEDLALAYTVTRNIAIELNTRLQRTNQDVLKLSSALSLALSRR